MKKLALILGIALASSMGLQAAGMVTKITNNSSMPATIEVLDTDGNVKNELSLLASKQLEGVQLPVDLTAGERLVITTENGRYHQQFKYNAQNDALERIFTDTEVRYIMQPQPKELLSGVHANNIDIDIEINAEGTAVPSHAH